MDFQFVPLLTIDAQKSIHILLQKYNQGCNPIFFDARDDTSIADVFSGRLVSPATPDRIESPKKWSTRDTGHQPTDSEMLSIGDAGLGCRRPACAKCLTIATLVPQD